MPKHTLSGALFRIWVLLLALELCCHLLFHLKKIILYLRNFQYCNKCELVILLKKFPKLLMPKLLMPTLPNSQNEFSVKELCKISLKICLLTVPFNLAKIIDSARGQSDTRLCQNKVNTYKSRARLTDKEWLRMT